MANKREVVLDAPIPGQSLTAEPKSRPWRRAYRFSTVDEAVEFYIPMFGDEIFTSLLAEQMENGVPLTTIAEILTTSNVMEGNHSIDIAVLVSPVLIEAMQFIADEFDIKPVIGTESEIYRSVDRDTELVRRSVKKVKEESSDDLETMEGEMEVSIESDMPMEEPQQEDMPMRKGLMAPRGEA